MAFRMPTNFLWGAASAAYQIEGGTSADGRGPSIWDTFCRKPGMIKDGSSGDNACDSYRRWAEDVAALKKLGVRAYRFSIGWPRVLPTGRGKLNQKGLDYYSRLVDALLANDIRPFVTLYHWDLPQALEDEGGWQVRATAEAFAEYAAAMAERLGDRVRDWMTFNEIATGIGKGYELGIYAPALRVGSKALAQVYHHSLVAHGLAVKAIRAARANARVGIVIDPLTPVPVIEDKAHLAACRKAYLRINGFLLEPLFRGKYPRFMEAFPDVRSGDMALIAQPLDFTGLNIYSGLYTEPAAKAPGYRLPDFPLHYPGAQDLDWLRFVPQALYWAVRHLHEIYGCKTIFITENGFSTDSRRDEESSCNDLDRILYLRCYLRELHHAIAEGLPVRGYFHWSLLDNFEWSNGYTKRLGLYYVRHATGERRAKRSFDWYRQVVKTNSIV